MIVAVDVIPPVAFRKLYSLNLSLVSAIVIAEITPSCTVVVTSSYLAMKTLDIPPMLSAHCTPIPLRVVLGQGFIIAAINISILVNYYLF